MKDPDHGEKPSESGASAAGRGEVRTGASRSGKGKRRRRRPSGSPSAIASQSGPSGEAGRPAALNEAEPSRKRKRRRRSKSAKPEDSSAASGARAPEPDAAAGDKKNNKRNRKARHRRGLQGRPLASTNTPPATVRAGEAVRSRSGDSAAPRQQQSRAERPGGQPGAPFVAPSEPPAPLYAALDLGTNNCRLLIAQPTRPGQFRVVDAFSRIVRLGEGLGASGRLSDDAMERSVEALKVCAAKLGARSIRRHRLIATEAARAAANGEAFMRRVAEETGLDLEIIDRETEARLAVSGCSSLVDRETKSVVLFDIGGGSSEIAVIRIGENRSSRLANHITHWTSLPVGVVTLSERHGGEHVTPQSFEVMVREVEAMLAGFECPSVDVLASGSYSDGFHLIGTSGTVTTLAGVHLDLPRYDRRRVDGLWLSDDEVSAMQARLLSWDFAARAANPCIGPDRADLVLAGCAILEAIRRRWPSTRMRVADRGLREGLLTDMMADDGAWRRARPRRHQRSFGPPQAGEECAKRHEGTDA
ncbi:Ppx/GppA phosphatase family protein [Sinorhizobium medicae]|uniref:Ppx/GppA phosphatase family protein n=2 Tax=Sinorhizobium medicae TaxID=110321 RepID=UPI000307D73E|nr:Ppx/GppA phosphatase family protein [Sinorhizobium medicae]MBO1939290.1 exopolyphosphatase [Sinorhizobium medicae]MBO1963484.1 exopolyphosphatase [Sinorhizobium medicae]MDX0958856.1 exopolyphosphatase [Sinorhizobium medicae]UFX02508.1 exopolyphosphatase [Sinorhizobium medicae WSM1115]UWU08539.1 exopolyphosphatase [Sinorhizobium medicae]